MEKENETKSKLDELLEDSELKAEYEARLQEAVESAVAQAGSEDRKEEPEQDDAAEEPPAEAGKEASIDEERMKNLDTREKNLLMRELKATAIEELGKE